MKSHCCIVDSITDPDDECVFDDNNFEIEDCEIAIQLMNSGKNKNDCQYWVERCPSCGFVFTN